MSNDEGNGSQSTELSVTSPSDYERKHTLRMRMGAFAGGLVFLGLGAADAMFDPFPGPETFFAGTGVVLIAIAITGRAPRNESGS